MSYFEGVDIIAAFERAMRDASIVPVFTRGGIIPDGKLVRFHVEGDKRGTRNGWCVLFGDGIPAGEFGSWKTGDAHTWCAKDASAITPDEQRAIKARIAEARAAREREEKARQGEAAKLANLLWNAGIPADDDHPYLIRKGVRAHAGMKLVDWPVRNADGEVFRTIADTLVIPIFDIKGKIVSLQGVFPQTDKAFGRDKDFLVGGKKRGCYFVIGKPQPGKPVAICEGYATGETIHQATGWCVVVAWDAYNLPHVAKAWREQMPTTDFVICADNDQFTKPTPENPRVVENPGVLYGRAAAAEIRARVVWPVFADLEGEPTDFNDLANREGIDVAQSQIIPPPLPATIDPQSVRSGNPALTRAGYTLSIDPDMVDLTGPFPDIDGKAKPLPTALNLAVVCERLGVIVRYNTIKKDMQILVPGVASSVDNEKEVSSTELRNWLQRFRMPTTDFDSNLVSLGESNKYNPVATWIESKEWDGVSRLQSFFDTVTAKIETRLPDGRSLKEVLMRKWLISAVAAAYEPNGVVARGVLTFVSKQNLGKTRWAKQLAPRELNVIQDGEVLNPSDKDSVMKVVSKWIVELGEVDATFRKSDIAALKAFISRDTDSLRRPYMRCESQYARRTIFFASVNDEQFLHDPTGNTRWWTIHAIALGEPAKLDMQQVWAEVKSLYDAGASWHLDPDELDALNGHNREHESINPVHEKIDKVFDWDSSPVLWTHPMIATDIALAAGFDKPTKKDVNDAAAYVVKQYGVETKRIGKSKVKHWMMPARMRGHTPDDPF